MVDFEKASILVIGAGVSGLTTAIRLAEAGLRTRVRATLPPQRTTSAAAGASWGPYMVTDPRILRWSAESLRELNVIARAHPDAGVHLVDGLEAADYPMDPPAWAREVDGFAECDPAELPPGYVSGWRYRIPIVDMPRYLAHLERRLTAAGGLLEIGDVPSLDDVAHEADLIVNCTGLGSGALTSDKDLHASRGQIVVVTNPGIDEFFQDNTHSAEPTYILPQGDHVVLGGSVRGDSRDASVNADEAQEIIARCLRVEPRLTGASVLECRVGLRPVRSEVRLESTSAGDGTPVIHNYGHGGGGVTLSWGCAAEVRDLLSKILATDSADDPAAA